MSHVFVEALRSRPGEVAAGEGRTDKTALLKRLVILFVIIYSRESWALNFITFTIFVFPLNRLFIHVTVVPLGRYAACSTSLSLSNRRRH